MRRVLIAFGLFCPLMGAVPPTLAEAGKAGPAEVVAKVREAVTLIRQVGDGAIAVIADPFSGFMWKDTYVFVVDCGADRVMANPAFPERAGGDIMRHTDYSGKRYGPELCDTAARPGGGWIEYVWLKPGGETPLRKISFVMSVPGTPYQVGAGVYDEATPLEELSVHVDPADECGASVCGSRKPGALYQENSGAMSIKIR